MQQKLEDVIYANFAQMAYLHWGTVPRGTELYDALYTRRKKDGSVIYANKPKESRQAFTCYTEEPDYMAPLWDRYLSGWELVYAADRPMLVKDLFGLTDVCTSNGFYAVCFRRKHQYIISFRGTDDLEDAFADLHLGFFDIWNDQLSCVEWFIRYLWEHCIPATIVPEIHFTGHSLGGALAQFASTLPSVVPTFCVTWNALGFGVFLSKEDRKKWRVDGVRNIVGKTPELNAVRLADDLYHLWKTKYSQEENLCAPSIHTTHFLRQHDDRLYQEILHCILKHSGMQQHAQGVRRSSVSIPVSKGFKISFGVKDSVRESQKSWEEKHPQYTKTQVQSSNKRYQYMARELMQLFILPKLFSESVKDHGINQTNCVNYYFPDDWTANLQTRIGYVVDVTQPKQPNGWTRDVIKDFDYNDDSVIRIFRQTIKNFGSWFDKHGVDNFLLYMNDEGNIHAGTIRDSFLRNVVRDYFHQVMKKTNLCDSFLRYTDKTYLVHENDLPQFMDVYLQLPYVLNEVAYSIKERLSLFWNNIVTQLQTLQYERFHNDTEGTWITLGRYSNLLLDSIDGRRPCRRIYIVPKEEIDGK